MDALDFRISVADTLLNAVNRTLQILHVESSLENHVCIEKDFSPAQLQGEHSRVLPGT
jgi:hypothetical protein